MSKTTTINTESVFIGGVEYAPISSSTPPQMARVEGLPYVIIRTRDAGVHAGFLKKKESSLAGIEVELVNARRIWYWEGAFTLSTLATEGTSKPESCKFPCEVDTIELVAIEIIPCTEKAMQSIRGVKVWQK